MLLASSRRYLDVEVRSNALVVTVSKSKIVGWLRLMTDGTVANCSLVIMIYSKWTLVSVVFSVI